MAKLLLRDELEYKEDKRVKTPDYKLNDTSKILFSSGFLNIFGEKAYNDIITWTSNNTGPVDIYGIYTTTTETSI